MSEKTNNTPPTWELYVDGAARNNPGPAGAGFYLAREGKSIEQLGFYLGNKTNNQAEYIALLLGAYYAQIHIPQGELVIIKADSQLMVRQITGEYKVKNPELSRLYITLKTLLDSLHYRVMHIPREQNKIADKLANMGIDRKIPVPQELLILWPIYENNL